MGFGTVAFLTLAVLVALVATVVPRRWRWLAWTLVIVAGVAPWGSWTGHPHWSRIEWMPFSRIVRIRDLVLNLTLYAPLGYFVASSMVVAGRRRRIAVAVVGGLMLSAATEFAQVYSHGRFPAMTDVVMNVLGTVVGVMLVRGAEPASTSE